MTAVTWREARRRAPVATVPGPGFVPRLHVRRDQDGCWSYDVWEGCLWHTGGRATTHAEALAVGLAALETASLEHAR